MAKSKSSAQQPQKQIGLFSQATSLTNKRITIGRFPSDALPSPDRKTK